MGLAQNTGQDSFFVEVADDSRERRGKPAGTGDGGQGTGDRWGRPEAPHWELTDISVLWWQWESSPTPQLYPSMVGRIALGDTEVGMGQCLRLWSRPGCRPFPISSAWGRPGPSHAPPGMQGSWELSKSVTFPLESEVSQPPRPGPAFLTGIQHKQGAKGRGKLRGPSACHLMAPSCHSLRKEGV